MVIENLKSFVGPILALGLSAMPAAAADIDTQTAYRTPPANDAWNPWMLRVRLEDVQPSMSGSTVSVSGVPSLSSPSSGLSISSRVLPEFDISYFFNRNIATEIILGLIPQKITGTGSLANLDVGHVRVLAPTLMVQYHFTDFGPIRPYVGVGVTYAAFFDQSPGNVVNGGIAVTSLNVIDSVGAGAQVGIDYMIDRHWGLNLDIKKFYLEPGYTAVSTAGPFNLPVSGTAHINPLLLASGIAYKF